MQVLITGAAGRLGQLLRKVWLREQPLGFDPVWSARHRVFPAAIAWDIMSDPAPFIAEGSVILHLAGALRGDAAALSSNSDLALKVCAAAKKAGVKHVFLASSASVYQATSGNLVEVQPPCPQSDYGRAKLNMERDALCWAHGIGADAPGVTCLRIGNVLGADALLGKAASEREILLDPVSGHDRGPMRSYIGPHAFAQTLAALVIRAARGAPLPKILNIAAPKPVYMADLLIAAKHPFCFGPPNSDVIPMVSLCTSRLAALVPLPAMPAETIVADWQSLVGCPA